MYSTIRGFASVSSRVFLSSLRVASRINAEPPRRQANERCRGRGETRRKSSVFRNIVATIPSYHDLRMLFANLDLARRLERAEAFAGSQFAISRGRLIPGCGSATAQIAG